MAGPDFFPGLWGRNYTTGPVPGIKLRKGRSDRMDEKKAAQVKKLEAESAELMKMIRTEGDIEKRRN